jgi:long-subunit fatty acid transport protein
MNIKIISLIAFIFCAFFFTVKAQNISDAARYSYLNPSGTARSFGVGGSFGAMGADFSSITSNPAGLAAYRKSEFTITPSLTTSNTSAFFVKDKSSSIDKTSSAFSVANIGLVLTKNKKNNSSFALGFNKIADFNRSYTVSGNTIGSMVERFAERANQKSVNDLDDFEAYPAYNVGAIFDADSNNVYETDINKFDVLSKTQRVNQTGGINEFSIAYAKNMNEKFLLGVSLGVPFLSFEETKNYEETDPQNVNPIFNQLNYNEYLNTTGIGFNIKAGFVYVPIKNLRIGGSFHSPTYYTLNDDYNSDIEYSYFDKAIQSYEAQSPDGNFKYKFNTPARLTGSIGTILDFGKIKGFINADAEFVDYNTNKYNFTSYSDDPSEKLFTNETNIEIEQYLGSVLNLRLGTELAIGKFRVRGGIERGDDPISANNKKIQTVSLGLGMREENFFLDFAFRNRKNTQGYIPYVLVDQARESLANITGDQSKFVLTFGFKI